jgi:hypothetical protein
MRKKILIALLAALAAIPALAQGPPVSKVTAQEIDTPPFVGAPTVPNATASPTFQGNANCYYWIITQVPGATSAPLSLPLTTCSIAAGGTAQNPILLSWGTVPNATYDVLETTTSTMPVGTNTVAIATGLTVTNLTDSGQARSSYVLLPQGLNWQEFNNRVAGLPTLQWCYNGNCVFGINPNGVTGGGIGTVTSVGLSVQPVLQLTDTITNSPVTTNGVINIQEQWNPVQAGYFLGGPITNSVGGLFDGFQGVTGTGTAISATATPTTATDLAIMAVQDAGASGFTMPGGWTQQATNGASGAVFFQKFSTSAPITAPVTAGGAAAPFTGLLSLIRTNGTPVFVQQVMASGALGGNNVVGTLGGNVGAGHSLLGVFCITLTSGGNSVFSVTDSAGDLWTQIGFAQNTGNNACAIFLSANVTGGNNPSVTSHFTGPSSSGPGFFLYAEISNLAAQTGEPVFEPLPVLAPPQVAPATLQYNTTNPAGGTILAGTNTTIGTISLTTPTVGCPCRINVIYSIYITTGPSPTITMWVSDGTNVWASTQVNYVNGIVGGQAISDLSPVTYANNTAVVLTLIGRSSNAGGGNTTVTAAPAGGTTPPNSYFRALVVSSN